MFTTAFRDTVLGTIGGFLGLIKGITDFRAGTVTEAAYTGYGTRPAIAWGAAENTTPTGGRQVANSGIVTFPANTGANEDQIAWGIYSLATAGVLQMIGFLDTDPPILGTVSLASPGVVTAPAHGLVVDQRVFFLAAPGALLPTGFAENTAYYVGTAAAGSFTLSTTPANANPVNTSAAGAGFFMPYKAVTVAGGATPSVAVGAVVVQI